MYVDAQAPLLLGAVYLAFLIAPVLLTTIGIAKRSGIALVMAGGLSLPSFLYIFGGWGYLALLALVVPGALVFAGAKTMLKTRWKSGDLAIGVFCVLILGTVAIFFLSAEQETTFTEDLSSELSPGDDLRH